MKFCNYLQKLSDLDVKTQLKIRADSNPLPELWKLMTAERSAQELKQDLIRKYKLGITARSFENYIYGSTFPLRFAAVLIREHGDESWWERIYESMDAACFRSSLGGRTQWVRLPKEADEDLAYLAGALRDGYLNLRTGAIGFVQKSCREWLAETVIPAFERVFHVKMRLIADRALLYSYPIVYFLCAILEHVPGKQITWPTPSIVRCWPSALKYAYMRGYFDAEGSADVKRLRISVSQSWHKRNELPPSLLDLQSMLAAMNISCKINGPYDRAGTLNSVLVAYCREKPRNGISFFRNIGSSHPEKGRKLEQIYLSCLRLAHSQKLA